MENLCFHHASFSLHTIVADVCVSFVFIIFYCIYHFPLSLIHYWIQMQVFWSSSSHFHSSKPTLTMENLCFHHASFSLYTIIEDVCVFFVFMIF
jgi:hypothetical protein